MVNSSIAVHQHHGGGEVEEAGGEDQHLHGLVVRLAHGEGGHGEVEAAPEEDDDGVEAEGGCPAEDDVEQRHAGREHRGVQVRVHLRQVALHRDQNQAAAGGKCVTISRLGSVKDAFSFCISIIIFPRYDTKRSQITTEVQ